MFEQGRVYRRRDIHDRYGGQRQGGTVTPKDHPMVFLITGESGQPYGYDDHLDDNGVFHYFGHGQVGHMQFHGGNKAIRDHAKDEEELHLFELERPGYLRYMGEMICSGYEQVEALDRNGDPREAIVFQLVPAGDDASLADEGDDEEAAADSLEQARLAADGDVSEEQDAREGRRKTYARSRALKRYVRLRAAGDCEGCETPAPFEARDGMPYLEPHHTERRSDSGPGNRRTVIALCPTCHSRVHYGVDGDEYNDELKAKLPAIETA